MEDDDDGEDEVYGDEGKGYSKRPSMDASKGVLG